MEIVTLTMNPSVDNSSIIEHVIAERKLRCSPPRYDPGGGGINVSRAIHRLGGQSLAVYAVGGPMGQVLEGMLDRDGIERHPLPIAGWTREDFAVTETSSGRQFRFVMPGPKLEAREWQGCLEFLESLDPVPRYLVASGSLPPGVPADFYVRVARLCKRRGTRVIVDCSGAALVRVAREGVFLLKPNLRELEALVDRELLDEAEQEVAARELIERGNEAIVVSMGAAGARLVSPRGTVRFHAPTVKIQSRVGAGDSMVAGIVLKLVEGWKLDDAVRYGVAAGVATVTMPGTELCRLEDVERIYRQWRPDPHVA